LNRPAELAAETLYVIGGLYGNREALTTVLAMADQEKRPVRIIFNGDFNWFNVDASSFEEVNRVVLDHVAIRGNVETELATEQSDAGCGCGYPDWVDDNEVYRSNLILARLKETARAFPAIRERLGRLPMHLIAEVGDLRVGIVHGDATSLNGWAFSWEYLSQPNHTPYMHKCFREADVRVFASTHTCLPVCREYDTPARCVVINNGAAGMPNFSGTQYGVGIRISRFPYRESLHRSIIEEIFIEAIPIRYDAVAWYQQFLANWPQASAGYASYQKRIEHGPPFTESKAWP
jgi:predicted phosphodiesterase